VVVHFCYWPRKGESENVQRPICCRECLDANRLIFSLSISHSFQPLDSRSRAQSRCQLLMCCVLRFFLSTSAHIKLTARHYVCWTLLLGFVVLLTWLLPRMANKFVLLLHRPVWTYWRIFVILSILELEHIVSVKESRFFLIFEPSALTTGISFVLNVSRKYMNYIVIFEINCFTPHCFVPRLLDRSLHQAEESYLW